MRNSLRASLFVTLAALSWSGVALGADVGSGYSQGPGGYYRPDDRSGPYAIGSDGVARLRGGQAQGAGSVATSQATAGSTATQLAAARPGRSAVTIENLGTVPVYVGAAGVTSANGFLLPGAVGASVTIPTSAAIFGVAGTGTQAVAVLETY